MGLGGPVIRLLALWLIAGVIVALLVCAAIGRADLCDCDEGSEG